VTCQTSINNEVPFVNFVARPLLCATFLESPNLNGVYWLCVLNNKCGLGLGEVRAV